jgi:uncharacterized metal-binding protein
MSTINESRVCEERRVMRLFAVVLALAVTASTQAMAFEPLHQRHAKMTRKAEVDDGCPAHRHRGVSGQCVLNPDNGPYKPDPYWTPCDYSSGDYPEGCGGP